MAKSVAKKAKKTKQKEASIFGDVKRSAKKLQRVYAGLIISFLIAAFLFWASFANLNQFTIATGKVVPQGRTHLVQHLEGGIIENIFVQTGQRVEEGQTLFRVMLGSTQQTKEVIEAEVAGLKIRQTRLRAEIEIARQSTNSVEISNKSKNLYNLPTELVDLYPEVAKTETQSFEARLKVLTNEFIILQNQEKQQLQEIIEKEAILENFTKELELNQRNLTLQEKLAEDNLISQVDILNLQAKVQSLQGRLLELKENIPGLKIALEGIREQRDNLFDSFEAQALDELVKVENSLNRSNLSLSRAENIEIRRDVKTPTTGILKEVLVQTAGEVIKPGQTLAEIVPETDDLVVEAELQTADRGKVLEGDDVLVKLTAYDYSKYGGVNGKVEQISADSFVSQQGHAFYKVIIRTDKNYLGQSLAEYPITPGMEVQADIQTGKRTVIMYLLKPVIKLKDEAFRQ